MAVVHPLRLVTNVQNLLDLHNHHLRVFIAWIKEKHSYSVDDVTIGLPVENSDEPTLLPFQIVKSLLCEISSTPDCVVLYYPS